MRTLIYRQNRMFKIDQSQLSEKARTSVIINGLYADIYSEFLEAQYSPKYAHMDLKTRIEAVNEFALNWLKQRGFK